MNGKLSGTTHNRWDSTLALISRQGLILDPCFFNHVSQHQNSDDWSFYDLTGCPSDLVIYLVELAELANQREIAARMAWLNFDLSVVTEVKRKVLTWRSEHFAEVLRQTIDTSDSKLCSDNTVDIEERLHLSQDRYHCAEAWRYALLIYTQRVFYWDRNNSPPSSLSWLARRTLDHVRSCRRTSQAQKQLLLPVFLAGSETTDDGMRRFAQKYCMWWATHSRYNMFNSGSFLLEEIWRAGSYNAWWGSVIDQKPNGDAKGEASTQFLFG